jgi:hypothetical protein
MPQKFATLFFQWAHTRCPLLKVLIWGSRETGWHSEGLNALNEQDEGRHLSLGCSELISQQCFVKRVRELDDESFEITATRVTRGRIRDDFPELQILDYDTGSESADRLAEEAVY